MVPRDEIPVSREQLASLIVGLCGDSHQRWLEFARQCPCSPLSLFGAVYSPVTKIPRTILRALGARMDQDDTYYIVTEEDSSAV